MKPANLLLDGGDSVHVSDFGIASAAGLDTLTLPGTVLGTAGYLSPEQARGEPATAASDRYALGVVAFELLTGRRPFAADTPVTEAFGHLNADVPSAERLEPSLPEGVDEVLQRALSKDPADRPGSSRELVAELRDACDTAGAPTLVQPPPAGVRAASAAVGLCPSDEVRPHAAPSRLSPGRPRAPRRRHHDRCARRSRRRRSGRRSLERRADDRRAAATGARATATGARAAASFPAALVSASSAVIADADLNDDGFALMQSRDYAGALPLFEQAVASLAGSGSLAEAYASYNLAFTRFAVGRCDGVISLLDRSESIQGERKEIDRLRPEGGEGVHRRPWKGHGQEED